MYSLFYINSIIDEQSSYLNNTGQNGGIYYIVGFSQTATDVQLSKNSYNYNYGTIGGVLAIYNVFTLNIFENTYLGNQGERGGVIYSG